MAQPDDMFGDEDYPAYTMGRAAEITGSSQDFLRRLDEAKLFSPFRSASVLAAGAVLAVAGGLVAGLRPHHGDRTPADAPDHPRNHLSELTQTVADRLQVDTGSVVQKQ